MKTINGKYTSANIMIDEVEESCLKQIESMCDDTAFNNPIVIMPDCHQGKGSVIGFTMPFTDRVNPEVVGVDLGCGMKSWCLGNKPLKWILSNLVDIDKSIKRTIPMGRNIHQKHNTINEIKTKVIDLYGNDYIESLKNLTRKIGMKYEMAIGSLCSLGGGNHFCEVGIDEEQRVWITVHSGSRNMGLRVANYHTNKMRDGGLSKKERNDILQNEIQMFKAIYSGQELNNKILEFRNSQINSPDNVTNYLTGKALDEYLEDMQICQQYAEINREFMLDAICKQLEKKIKISKYEFQEVESVHNYINFEDKIIRKGAISSYKDELLIIPFNMRDGLIIGRGKSNPDWNYSAPHGAGRLMSRTQARNTIPMQDYKNSMKDVYSSCISNKTVDESPMAYKSTDLIKSLIEPTVEIIHTVKPILNIKAED